MPSAPQKRACASGRSTDTLTTAVLSRPAASSLNFRTLAWHTPVSMLGKMLSTTRLPETSASVSASNFESTRSKPGACEPTAGSSPTVLTVLGPSCVVAMAPTYWPPVLECPHGPCANRRPHRRDHRRAARRVRAADAGRPGGVPGEVPQDGRATRTRSTAARACLFYNDVTGEDDDWADHGAERIWIHGDLHVENFGTYLNSDGRLVFDVNDFDEAYLGRFTWDLQRFAASLALVGWQKALPEDAIRKLIGRYVRSYLAQVNHYVGLRRRRRLRDPARQRRRAGAHAPWSRRGAMRRADLLDGMTVHAARAPGSSPRTARPAGSRATERAEGGRGLPRLPRHDPGVQALRPRRCSTSCATSSGKSGFGIGSAGLPAYNVLVEGYSQALDNDVVLSMKQANIPAVSRFVDTSEVDAYFEHEGHRTVGQPAGAAGAHRPAARPHEHRRRRLRRLRGLALRGRPRLERDQRARRHARRWSTCSVARPRRSTAPPTRTASRTSSTSRSRRRSPTSLEGRRNEFVAVAVRLGDRVRRPRARGPRAVRRRLPRGPGRDRRRPDPRGRRRLRRRWWTCRRSGRRPRRRAARPARGRRGRRR